MWYGPGRVGREFRPRHALLTMHVWFLHKRLIQDTHDLDAALMVQEELFNILWDDATSRIRQTGTSELLVNKHLMQVQQYTFLHLTHYDHAFTDFYLQRPLERMKELRNLVSHHIFRDPAMMATDPASSADDSITKDGGSDPTSSSAVSPPSSSEVSTDLLDRYAWYIEANYQNIMLHWPDEHYREGRVAWVNVPDFSALKDSRGELLPENPVHPEDVLPSPWLTNITRRGVEYYWNPETRESRWERPQ
jgi:cytochrome b pre-mRNA-processing protein 3